MVVESAAAPPLGSPAAVTAAVVKQVAAACGLTERRPEASYTLYFHSPALNCNFDVYYTTRSLRTQLNHPKQGENSLWRSDTYASVSELVAFFRNPRLHTNKGYRRAGDATRACFACGTPKKRSHFSEKQWRQGPDKNRCKECVTASRRPPPRAQDVREEEDEGDAAIEKAMESLSIAQPAGPIGKQTGSGLRSTEEELSNNGASQLRRRDAPENSSDRRGGTGRRQRKQGTAKLSEANVQKLERKTDPISRRQFRCPRHGVFFKKVPDSKPVSACAECRMNGYLQKWKAVPRDKEKGFGLFRCPTCNSSWGSSKACRSLGQFCAEPQCSQGDTPVFPFRILPEKRPKAKPMASLDETQEQSYAHEAFRPFHPPDANDAGGYGSGFYQALQEYEDAEDIGKPADVVEEIPGAPEAPRHRCTGCADGLCRDRKVPMSLPHDSTGSTASTCSEKTWSTASGLGNYADRDA